MRKLKNSIWKCNLKANKYVPLEVATWDLWIGIPKKHAYVEISEGYPFKSLQNNIDNAIGTKNEQNQ
jgi:hypothetical protein